MTSAIAVVECVYATLVPDTTGGAACLYWSRGVPGYGPGITLLDLSIGQLTPDFWRAASERLSELSAERRARRGSIGIFVEGEMLAQYAEARGHPVRPVFEHLTKPEAWSDLCAIVMSYQVEYGKIAVSAAAVEKARGALGRPVGAFNWRGGPRPDDDPTVPAFLYGVVLGLDAAAARPPKPARVKVVA